jgi:hypothetical protein
MRFAFTFIVLVCLVSPVVAQDASLVSIAVTPSGDGVLTVPVNGDGVFAVAVINIGPVGVATRIIAGIGVPGFSLTLFCETTTSGNCRTPLGTTDFRFESGEIKTFAGVVHAASSLPYDRANRVTVSFFSLSDRNFIHVTPIGGPPYSVTSVSVKTQP